MTILYVETNFLMSIATGRDPSASLLLSSSDPRFRFTIPGVCYLEAAATLEAERRHNHQFIQSLEQRKGQLRRDLVSEHARLACDQLEQLILSSRVQFAEVERRLLHSVVEICGKAEVIEAVAPVVRDAMSRRVIEGDLADNLILHSVAHHARARPDEPRAFLSGNTRDFGKTEVREFLRDAGVSRFFSEARPFLDWIGSLPPPTTGVPLEP